jgi:hypothetical protein
MKLTPMDMPVVTPLDEFRWFLFSPAGLLLVLGILIAIIAAIVIIYRIRRRASQQMIAEIRNNTAPEDDAPEDTSVPDNDPPCR